MKIIFFFGLFFFFFLRQAEDALLPQPNVTLFCLVILDLDSGRVNNEREIEGFLLHQYLWK